jgi:hypothetical protein
VFTDYCSHLRSPPTPAHRYAMSFLPLDRINFSRDESALEDTPVRLRAARCRSPVPESDRSGDRSGRDLSRRSSTATPAVQSAPAHQPSIPRHRPIIARDELLRTIDESVTELRDELHNHSAESVADSFTQRARIADICNKLDVIATVVLRHERELKAFHAAPAAPLWCYSIVAALEARLSRVPAVRQRRLPAPR